MLKYKISNSGSSLPVEYAHGVRVVRVQFPAPRPNMYDIIKFKSVFDPVLEKLLDKRLEEFSANTSDSFIKNFVLYSKNLVMAGGKRVRPYLAYLMYISLGGKEVDSSLNLFTSLEIFHTFCLVHDDIMDKSTIRHGVETIPAYVSKKLLEEKRRGDLHHVGNAQGILIGDLLFSWAMEVFIKNGCFSHDNIVEAQKYFYKMIDEVVLGQMIDIDITTRETAYEELIEEKTRLKTSRYSFVRPMQIGASLAKKDHQMDEFCETLGTRLGIAFQVQDDLLDLIGDPEVTHKNILRDIADYQHTFFTNYIFTSGTNTQKTYLKQIFGKEVAEEKQKDVQDLFISSGAINAGNQLIEKNLREAKVIVETSDLPNENKQYFLQLINVIEQRKS